MEGPALFSQRDDKSKNNDSIKIVSRGNIPAVPAAKGASRAAKMRAMARGEDTASTLKQEQQVIKQRCFCMLLLLLLCLESTE